MGRGRSAIVLSEPGTESRTHDVRMVEYVLIARGASGKARLRIYDAPVAEQGTKVVDVTIDAGEDIRNVVYPPEICPGIFVSLTKTGACEPHCEVNY